MEKLSREAFSSQTDYTLCLITYNIATVTVLMNIAIDANLLQIHSALEYPFCTWGKYDAPEAKDLCRTCEIHVYKIKMNINITIRL